MTDDPTPVRPSPTEPVGGRSDRHAMLAGVLFLFGSAVALLLVSATWSADLTTAAKLAATAVIVAAYGVILGLFVRA